MSSLEKLFEDAKRLFGLGAGGGRGRANTFYVEVPGRLSRGGLSLDRNHPLDRTDETRIETKILLSPLNYLTGLKLGDNWWFDKTARDGPSISIVVGEYGLGKTELLHCVAEALHEARVDTGVDVLPVSLSSARGLRTLAESFEPRDFLCALLLHLTINLTEPQLDEIFARIADGSLVLLLDALDELVSDETEHHAFMESLGRLSSSLTPAVGFHIILSMRLEHLNKVYRGKLQRAGKRLEVAADHSVAVDFLLLDFFSDAMVRDYVSYRLEDPKIMELLPRSREFQDLLRRPLLARILCDLVPSDPRKRRALLQDLQEVTSAAALLRLFTHRARIDPVLKSAQAEIRERLGGPSELRWSHRKLSAVSLKAHLGGKSELDRQATLKILVAEPEEKVDAEQTVAAVRLLSDDDLWMTIYKCPFLNRAGSHLESADPALRVAFTHRVFFEYFVTEGVILELKELWGSNNLAFHNLVLNVDMHRFLRDLTILTEAKGDRPGGEKLWYLETGRAYGLEKDCEREWSKHGRLPKDRKKWLDDIRRPLLDARSGLKDSEDPKMLRGAVLKFLEEDDGSGLSLPPRYLIPNYEAVAVCLLKPWIGTEDLHRRFADLLGRRLDKTVHLLLGDALEPDSREIYELLVERLLDVGLRCNYAWARRPYEVVSSRHKAAGDETGLLLVIERGENTRLRLDKLLQEAKRDGGE